MRRLLLGGDARVLISAHPAYVLRNEGYRRAFEDVLATIPAVIGNGITVEQSYLRLEGQELRKFLHVFGSQQKDPVAIDLETTGLNPFRGKVKSVAVSVAPGEAVCFRPEAAPHALRAFLRSPVPKVFHNGQFDAAWLLHHLGVYPANIVWDTQLGAQLKDENGPAGLKVLALRHTDLGAYADEVQEKVREKGWENLTFEDLWEYNCKDADATLRVYEVQKEDAYLRQELPAILRQQETLVRMRVRGMTLDVPGTATAQREIDAEIEAKVAEMRALPAVKVWEKRHEKALNPASPAQIRQLMEGTLGLPFQIRSRKTGVASTGKESLRQLREYHPFVSLVEEYRKTIQLRKNFLVPLLATQVEGVLHPEWRLGGTRTWRLSCADPNIQNIPKNPRIRKLFRPRPGRAFIAADYSQAELRVVASLSGEEALIRAFRAGVDAHTATASALHGVPLHAVTPSQREEGKRCNFAVVYGISPEGMHQKFGLPIERAKAMLRQLWESMPAVARWLDEIHEKVQATGEVFSPFGRIRRLPDAQGRDRRLVEHALRQAGNFPPQHAAAELTLRAMVRLDRLLPGNLVAQIHDSILIECPESTLDEVVGQVRTTLEDTSELPWLTVPLVVDVKVGDAWHEMESADADPEE